MPKRERIDIENVTQAYPLLGRTPLSVSHPGVAATWHWKKNCGFGPEDFSKGSGVYAWWICEENKEHIYKQQIKTRVRGSNHSTNGCPYCSGTRVSKSNWLKAYPKIARELHPTNNGDLTPKTIVAASGALLWWQCSRCKHEWRTSPCARTRRGAGCPRCNLGDPLDLKQFPKALKMFDRARNKGVDPRCLQYHALYWWKCNKAPDHHFKAGFYKHNNDAPECPFCRGKKPSSTNNLGMLPEVAKYFHPTKNGKLKPKDLTRGSHKRIWWKCDRGRDHEWEGFVYMQKRKKTPCPFCSNDRFSITNAICAYEAIARDFHPTRNGAHTAKTVSATSVKRVHWLCARCGLEWQARPYDRTQQAQGCPECKKRSTGVGRLTERQRKSAKQLLRKSLPVKTIAEQFGVHIMTIYRLRDTL